MEKNINDILNAADNFCKTGDAILEESNKILNTIKDEDLKLAIKEFEEAHLETMKVLNKLKKKYNI